jgi:hypothetical protein
VAAPFPLTQPLVKAGLRLDGCEASVTETFDADPFTAETCTEKPAFCPRWTLDAERCTLTHSWDWALAAGLAARLEVVTT